MPNQPTDRERMRNDLRELAKLAATPAPVPVAPASTRGFDTADSSGFVDLAAFSARDPHWVDRELARSKSGRPPPLPKRAVVPPSMAPVAMDALSPIDTAALRPKRSSRAPLAILGGSLGVAIVAFLAVTVARHRPATAPQAAAAAAVPPPAAVATTVDAPAAAPAAPAVAPAATDPSAPSDGTAQATPSPSHAATAPPVAAKASSKKGSPSPAPAHAHAAAKPAARPVAIPASKPAAGGGNDLMSLIKQSVAAGK